MTEKFKPFKPVRYKAIPLVRPGSKLAKEYHGDHRRRVEHNVSVYCGFSGAFEAFALMLELKDLYWKAYHKHGRACMEFNPEASVALRALPDEIDYYAISEGIPKGFDRHNSRHTCLVESIENWEETTMKRQGPLLKCFQGLSFIFWVSMTGKVTGKEEEIAEKVSIMARNSKSFVGLFYTGTSGNFIVSSSYQPTRKKALSEALAEKGLKFVFVPSKVPGFEWLSINLLNFEKC